MRATAVTGEGSGSNASWVFFFVVGLLLITYGVYAMTLPILQPDHWDDITTDPTVVSYIGINFQWLGLLGFGLGMCTAMASYASFRRGEKWAWIAFWLYPAFFLLAVPFTWIGFGWIFVLAASLIALVSTFRRSFPKAASSTSEGPR